MLGAFVDFLNNANGAAKRLKREYPKEEIVFASAVTILETTETSPVGWSFKRFLQRRGVAVFSQDYLFLDSSLWSLLTLLHLILIAFVITESIQNESHAFLLLGIIPLLYILQRLPYRKRIAIKDITNANVNSVQSLTGLYSLLTIHLADKAINIVPARPLPEEVVRTLPVDTNRKSS